MYGMVNIVCFGATMDKMLIAFQPWISWWESAVIKSEIQFIKDWTKFSTPKNS